MTRIPRDPELVAQGKILALLGAMSPTALHRTLDLVRERFETASATTGTTRALAEALAPMIAGRRAGERTEGAEPDWDMRPPALDSRGPGT